MCSTRAAQARRFDRQVVVPCRIRGREQIIRCTLRKVRSPPDVRPDILARGTPGFSGAESANLVNEAALFAARSNKRAGGQGGFRTRQDR